MYFSRRWTTVVLAVASLLVGVAAQPPNMVFGDDPRKPVEVNDELLCEACNAVFDVVNKKVGAKRTEDAIYAAVEKVCDQSNFRVYKMIPPTMKKGCDAFLDKYGEGLEEKMYKEGATEARDQVCGGICKGVEYTPPPTPESAPPPKAKRSKGKKKKHKKEKKEDL